jgi:hypothetical protein
LAAARAGLGFGFDLAGQGGEGFATEARSLLDMAQKESGSEGFGRGLRFFF